MPGKAMKVRCSVPSCRVAYFTATPQADGGRCHKCAAYWRGANSEFAKQFRAEQARLRAASRQKRRRKEVAVDATEGREEWMRERAAILSDFLKGGG